MGHIEATKQLSATPDALWAVVSNLNTWSDWFTIHDKWLGEPPATIAVGTNLVAKIMMLGMANKIEWAVTDVEAPSKLALAGTGMAGVKCAFTFTITAKDGGSEISVGGDFEGSLIKGALGKAVEKDGVKQLEKSLQALDALATAGA